MGYDWQLSIILDYKWVLLKGTLWMLLLSLTSILIGTIIGIFWGIFLGTTDERWREVRDIIAFPLNNILRALPLLILIYLVNYTLPSMFSIYSSFVIAVIALSFNLAAFIADVLRGAIDRVPENFTDAARSVGMTEQQVMRRITLPESLRSVIPSITLLYIDILKMSSLASLIAFPELTYVGGMISNKEFRPLEVFVAIASIYIIIIYTLSVLQRKLEKTKWFLSRS